MGIFFISTFVYYFSIFILNVCHISSSYERSIFILKTWKIQRAIGEVTRKHQVQYLAFCSFSFHSFCCDRDLSLLVSLCNGGDACCKVFYLITIRRTVTEVRHGEQQDESVKWHEGTPTDLELDFSRASSSDSWTSGWGAQVPATVAFSAPDPTCSHHNLHSCEAKLVTLPRTFSQLERYHPHMAWGPLAVWGLFLGPSRDRTPMCSILWMTYRPVGRPWNSELGSPGF